MRVADLTSLQELEDWPRARLATLLTQMHRLARLSELLEGPERWVTRDDLTGLALVGRRSHLRHLKEEPALVDAESREVAVASR